MIVRMYSINSNLVLGKDTQAAGVVENKIVAGHEEGSIYALVVSFERRYFDIQQLVDVR